MANFDKLECQLKYKNNQEVLDLLNDLFNRIEDLEAAMEDMCDKDDLTEIEERYNGDISTLEDELSKSQDEVESLKEFGNSLIGELKNLTGSIPEIQTIIEKHEYDFS